MDEKLDEVKARRRGGLRVRFRYVIEYKDRHGKMRRYFRRSGQKLIALPGDPGEPEFIAAYSAALATQPHEVGRTLRSSSGTVSGAIAGYYQSPQWRDLARGTQNGRRRILEHLRTKAGNLPIAAIQHHQIAKWLGDCSTGSARNWLSAMRELMRYAVRMKLRADDPTDGIESPKPARKDDDDDTEDGHRTWADDEITQFEAYWPIGSKPRLAFALALYTAQRRSDILRMGPQHVKGGVLTIRQQKTKIIVHIPIDQRLRAVIDASACGDMVYLVTNRKAAYSGSALGWAFRQWCDKANLPADLRLHGLRKAWCRRAAEAGASASEIMSVTGHQTLKEVERYIAAVNRELLAHRVIARISDGRLLERLRKECLRDGGRP
jgi:integrase